MGYSICSFGSKWDNATEYLFDQTKSIKINLSVTNVLNNIDKLFKPRIQLTKEEVEIIKNKIMNNSLRRLQNFVKIYLQKMRSRIKLKTVINTSISY